MFCMLLLPSLPCHRILPNIGPLCAFRASSPNYDKLFNLTVKMLFGMLEWRSRFQRTAPCISFKKNEVHPSHSLFKSNASKFGPVNTNAYNSGVTLNDIG